MKPSPSRAPQRGRDEQPVRAHLGREDPGEGRRTLGATQHALGLQGSGHGLLDGQDRRRQHRGRLPRLGLQQALLGVRVRPDRCPRRECGQEQPEDADAGHQAGRLERSRDAWASRPIIRHGRTQSCLGVMSKAWCSPVISSNRCVAGLTFTNDTALPRLAASLRTRTRAPRPAGVDEGDPLEVELERLGAVHADASARLEERVDDRQVELALHATRRSPRRCSVALTELDHDTLLTCADACVDDEAKLSEHRCRSPPPGRKSS